MPETVSLPSSRLRALRDAIGAGEVAAAEQFWREIQDAGAPLVEPLPDDERHVLVTFLWRGTPETRNVAVLGSFASREPANNQLTRLDDTNVWFRSYRLPRDLRTVYRLVENDSLAPLGQFTSPKAYEEYAARTARWRPDPLSRQPFPEDRPQRPWDSILALPGAPPHPWSVANPDLPAPSVEHHRFQSTLLGNERTVHVSTPTGYAADTEESAIDYGLLITFDGGVYTSSAINAPTTLANLANAGRIPPMIGIYIANPDQQTRIKELPCQLPLVRFLAEELLPWLHAHYRVTTDPARTVIAGSSFGALAAAFAALTRPDLFGNVLSQSGSYWWKPDGEREYEWLAQQYATRERLPLRFYLDAGTLEARRTSPDPTHPGQLVANRHMRDVLQARGYPAHCQEYVGGHDFVCWRGTLADGLLALLSRAASPSSSSTIGRKAV